MRIDGAQSIDRALALLLLIVDDGGARALAELGRELGLAAATSYRIAGSLRRAGVIASIGDGRFIAGPALASRRAQLSPRAAIAQGSRAIVRRAARAARGVAHLGVLDSDMVTYLVREGAGSGGIHSEEGAQLEAYCSGIGKMLLASLPAAAREAYLASAPFVALTERTITEPGELRAELAAIATQGFARDNGESSPDIQCLAVPIRDASGSALAALSLSRAGPALDERPTLAVLNDAKARIEAILFPA